MTEIKCNPETCKPKRDCLVFSGEIHDVGPALYLSAYGDHRPPCNKGCPLQKYFCSRPQGHTEDEHETHSHDDPVTAHARWQ